MQGPNFRWGDPLGSYEIEIIDKGCLFTCRGVVDNRLVPYAAFFMSTKAMTEMRGLLNMLELPKEFEPELPDGRIRGPG